jgi:hypothetical protein
MPGGMEGGQDQRDDTRPAVRDAAKGSVSPWRRVPPAAPRGHIQAEPQRRRGRQQELGRTGQHLPSSRPVGGQEQQSQLLSLCRPPGLRGINRLTQPPGSRPRQQTAKQLPARTAAHDLNPSAIATTPDRRIVSMILILAPVRDRFWYGNKGHRPPLAWKPTTLMPRARNRSPARSSDPPPYRLPEQGGGHRQPRPDHPFARGIAGLR